MSKEVVINYHPIWDNARKEIRWLNSKSFLHKCDSLQSHLTHYSYCGNNIWYTRKRIDVYNKDTLPLMKEFAKKFNYKSIELYEK